MKHYLLSALAGLTLTACTNNVTPPPLGSYSLSNPIQAPVLSYCEKIGSVSTDESNVIQATVANFFHKMDYQANPTCLLKWGDYSVTQYSIVWATANHPECPPFVCQHFAQGRVCCWPVGYGGYTICNK